MTAALAMPVRRYPAVRARPGEWRISAVTETAGLQAILEVYRTQHAKLIYIAECLLRTSNWPLVEADELVQTTMVEIWRQRETLPSPVRNPLSLWARRMQWELYEFARQRRDFFCNLERRFLQPDGSMEWGSPKIGRGATKRRLTINGDKTLGPRVVAEPEQIVLSPACWRFLGALRPLLSWRRIAAIALVYMGGYQQRDVAQVLGITLGAARSDLRQAERVIRQHPHLADLLREEVAA